MRAKKNEQRELGQVESGPRLVKASDFEARRLAKEEARRAQSRPVEASPALLRAPRNASEARDMFQSLFEAA